MDKIIKVCGRNCNCNFDVEHTRKIIDILASHYRDNETDHILMEILAGLTFAMTSDFDCILDQESTIEKDRNKTKQNIDQLYNFLYGGYRQ